MEPKIYVDEGYGRHLVCGDIHGNYRALVQVLERSNFDPSIDTLYTIGDLCDGWHEIVNVLETLKSIPNVINIRGNHDVMLNTYLTTGEITRGWIQSGGQVTMDSYKDLYAESTIVQDHIRILNNQHDYYIIEDRYLLVHAGYERNILLSDHRTYFGNTKIFYWDKELWEDATAMEYSVNDENKRLNCIDDFDLIFIGHSHIGEEHDYKPVRACQVWNLDTKAGSEGKLTLMDIHSREYWQSDMATELYQETDRAKRLKNNK